MKYKTLLFTFLLTLGVVACQEDQQIARPETSGAYLSTIAGNPLILNLSLLRNDSVLVDSDSDDIRAMLTEADKMKLVPVYTEPSTIIEEEFYVEGVVGSQGEPVIKFIPSEFPSSLLHRFSSVRFGVKATTQNGDVLEMVTAWVDIIGFIASREIREVLDDQ